MFILLGLPGSGKSVQSNLFKERKNIYHIAPGIALRKLAEEGDVQLQELLKTGALVDDKMVAEIIQREINQSNELFIIEGYPRTMEQIVSFKNILQDKNKKYLIKKVMVLDISPEIVVHRLTTRKVCGKCHKSFQNNTLDCDSCFIELTTRSDDNYEAIVNRMRVQGDYLKQILNYFTQENIPIEIINGNQSIEKVFEDIENVMNIE
jgi:adenylate kinase